MAKGPKSKKVCARGALTFGVWDLAFGVFLNVRVGYSDSDRKITSVKSLE